VERLDTAVAHFETALTHDLFNPTAHYRLGLVAMQRQDFETAVAHFTVAEQTIPNHRGLRKALGYSYAWLGDVETAVDYLRAKEEVPQELDTYVWWWQNQERPDLARQAGIVGQILGDSLDNDH
jgi:Flp pilus assembly protein TadD